MQLVWRFRTFRGILSRRLASARSRLATGLIGELACLAQLVLYLRPFHSPNRACDPQLSPVCVAASGFSYSCLPSAGGGFAYQATDSTPLAPTAAAVADVDYIAATVQWAPAFARFIILQPGQALYLRFPLAGFLQDAHFDWARWLALGSAQLQINGRVFIPTDLATVPNFAMEVSMATDYEGSTQWVTIGSADGALSRKLCFC